MSKVRAAKGLRVGPLVQKAGSGFLMFLVACSAQDESGDRVVFSGKVEEPSNYQPDGHSRYSIKVYVPGEDGEYELVELSQQNAAYFEENV